MTRTRNHCRTTAGGGPAEDSNTHAAGPGAADTSGGASPRSDENPYRDMTIAQKLNLADELLKRYEGGVQLLQPEAEEEKGVAYSNTAISFSAGMLRSDTPSMNTG